MNATDNYKLTKRWNRSIIRCINHSRKSQSPIFFLCVFLAIWLSACTTVDPNPFIKFNTAANEITVIDAAVDSHTLTVRERDMGQISVNPQATKNLALKFNDDDPFKYEFKFTSEVGVEPLFIKWQRLDSGLTELNAAFIEYTSLLVVLADGELIKVEDFDQLATDLNGNARSALTSLGREPDASKLALFSTAASAAAHAYISNKRKKYLINIINENQKSIDSFINFARETVGSLADDIKDPYVSTNRALLDQWAVSGNPDQKKAIAENIYSNSEITGITLDMLKSLDKTYESLAKTHKKLAIGLQNGQFSVSELVTNVKRLQQLYKDLKKANEDAEKAAA